jgi:crossover junction endonuclease MUS81
MIIKIDTREQELLTNIKKLVLFLPIFKQLKVETENLPLGDIIIADDKEEKLIIERKTVNDLLSSIKDGRYEEQSYRLNGLEHHNHNIIYLIEGDVNKVNRFKENQIEKLTSYSAMFSLNYYKGFSIFRTFNLDETALIICNMAYKLEKENLSGKKGYYSNSKNISNIEVNINQNDFKTDNINQLGGINNCEEENGLDASEKDYVNVIKKVKKDNVTIDNIDEIMLCQIPGISSVSALAIIKKFNTLSNLIKELEVNNDCLKNVSYTNTKGQIRKINKTCIVNIVKFLLKK